MLGARKIKYCMGSLDPLGVTRGADQKTCMTVDTYTPETVIVYIYRTHIMNSPLFVLSLSLSLCFCLRQPAEAQSNGPISQNREYRQHSPKMMDTILPILSCFGILGHHFGHLGGPGTSPESHFEGRRRMAPVRKGSASFTAGA